MPHKLVTASGIVKRHYGNCVCVYVENDVACSHGAASAVSLAGVGRILKFYLFGTYMYITLLFLQESCCFAVVGDGTATTPEQLQELLDTVSPEPDVGSPSDRLHSFDHIYPGAAGSTFKGDQAAR